MKRERERGEREREGGRRNGRIRGKFHFSH